MPGSKVVKPTPVLRRTVQPLRTFATHGELLADMDAHRIEVTATPEAAMAFLKRAGLVTASGKPRQMIRG